MLSAEAIGEILGTATAVLMLALALGVVAAIAFVPLRPRAERGPLERVVIDLARIIAAGSAVMFLLLPVFQAQQSRAMPAVYLLLLAAQTAWIWAISRDPSRALLLVGIAVNLAALPFPLAALLSPEAAIDAFGLVLLEGAAILLCAALLWPRTHRALAARLVSADFAASGRAATIASVGLVVLLALAGPGHGHTG